MKTILNIHDPREFVSSALNSYAIKREMHNEYQQEQKVRGFDYTKTDFIRAKFPRLPIKLRQLLSENL